VLHGGEQRIVAKLETSDTDVTLRPTPKARATRARLIATAAEAFVEEGYGATSVRDIAERSKMTSGAIYGHFSNKANLLGEAVRLRITEDLEEHGGRRYEEKALADWMAHTWRDYRTRRSLRALIVEGAAAARTDPDARRLLRGVVKAKLDVWAAQYREVWEQERLDPDVDPKAVLTVLFAAEVGMGVLEALDIELPRPGLLARAVGKLVGGLGPARRARGGA
jgi:AcrR family transcriptional regulator